jgi:hypothetical protein
VKASSRRGREHAEKFRLQLPELRSQFQGDRDFADADGVNPGAATRRDPRPDFGIIKTEPLPEFMPVISAPEQLGNLARKKEEQSDRIKKIVEEPDHSMARALDQRTAPLQEQNFGGPVLSRANDFP